MKDNIIQTKSYAFSLKIINLFKHLQDDKKEYDQKHYSSNIYIFFFNALRSKTRQYFQSSRS